MADENLATWAGGQLAGGAVGAVGSSLLTYGLVQAGSPLPGPGDPSSKLAAIQQTLNQIVSKLAVIEHEVSDVGSRILAAINKVDYNNRAGSLDKMIGPIFALTRRYKNVVASGVEAEKSSDAALKQRVQDERTDILNDINSQLVNEPSTIHNVVAGVGGTTPLYAAFAQAIKDAHRFLSYRDSDMLQARINYYQSAQYLQQLLLVAYFKAGRGLPGDEADAIKTFQDNMADENRFQVIPIPRGVVIDTKTDLVLYVETFQRVIGKDAWTWAVQRPTLDVYGWRLPTLAELISLNEAVKVVGGDSPTSVVPGIFTDYDSERGKVSPSQWLMDNGCYRDIGPLSLWTSDLYEGGYWCVDITNATTLGKPKKGGGNSGELGDTLQVHATGGDFSTSLLKTDGDAAAGRKPKPKFDPTPIARFLLEQVVYNAAFRDSRLGLPPDIESRYQAKSRLYRVALVLLALNELERKLMSVNFSTVRQCFEALVFPMGEQAIKSAMQDVKAIMWDTSPGYRSDADILNDRRSRLVKWLGDAGVPAENPAFGAAMVLLHKGWGYTYDAASKLLTEKVPR